MSVTAYRSEIITRLARHGGYLLLPLCLLLGGLPAATALELPAEVDELALAEHVRVLEDPNGTLDIDTVMDREDWTANEDTFNRGFSDSTWWLKVSVTNPSNRTRSYLLEIAAPLLDHVDIYLVSNGTIVRELQLGDKQPYGQRPIDHEYFLAPITWQPGQSLDAYVRVKSTSSVIVPLTLWNETAFYSADLSRSLAQGLLLGAILLIGAYNLLVYVNIRDFNYLPYVGFVFAMVLYLAALDGLTFRYLWPNATQWNDIAIVFTITLMVFFANVFGRYAMDMPTLSRPLNIMNVTVIIYTGILTPVSLFLPYEIGIQLAILGAMVGSVCGFLSGPVGWVRGRPAGKYFTYAWTALFIGSGGMVAARMGVIPSLWLANNGTRVGVAAEVILFSMALAARINDERRTRLTAQEHSLQVVQQANEELEARVALRARELDEMNQQLHRLSRTDQLTGLWNRRVLTQQLTKEYKRSRRHGRCLGVFIVDIDHFKHVNDTWGHQAGDACLREIAERIDTTARAAGGSAARLGGEEFCVLLPNTSTDQAADLAERIRATIAERPVALEAESIPITASVGVAAVTPLQNGDGEWLLKVADAALYRAKSEGRNCVRLERGDKGAATA